MKPAEVKKIKKIINQDKHYKTYYKSNTEELRVMVYQFDDDGSNIYSGNKYTESKEKESIIKLLNKLSSNGLRPKYKIEHKKYQGFINCTYVILL